MINLSSTPVSQPPSFPSLEAPHVISCLCILLEDFMHIQANMWICSFGCFFLLNARRSLWILIRRRRATYWPESLSHFFVQHQFSARSILGKWGVNWAEQGSRVIIHCHSPLGSEVSFPFDCLFFKFGSGPYGLTLNLPLWNQLLADLPGVSSGLLDCFSVAFLCCGRMQRNGSVR